MTLPPEWNQPRPNHVLCFVRPLRAGTVPGGHRSVRTLPGFLLKQVWHADEGNVGELKTHLILAGIGMGQPSQMTGEVLRAIRESDALIGAGRMLESAERALQNDLLISKEGKAENRQESAAAVEKETKCYKAYLPDDVIQIVSKHPEWKQAVILYSGDTGFFSGASRMSERLREAGYPFTVYPGTS